MTLNISHAVSWMPMAFKPEGLTWVAVLFVIEDKPQERFAIRMYQTGFNQSGQMECYGPIHEDFPPQEHSFKWPPRDIEMPLGFVAKPLSWGYILDCRTKCAGCGKTLWDEEAWTRTGRFVMRCAPCSTLSNQEEAEVKS